jgi:anaerobic selenocysteine-containing dehydrogenase
MGGNPVTQSPNSLEWEKALKKLDFLVSVDLFVNATGKFADIILPAAWWLEKTDLSEQWPILNYILLRQGVEPPGECWPEEKIIFELSKRMGLEGYFPWNSMEEVIDDLFSPLNVKNLKKNPSGIWIDKEIRYKKYEEHGFNTPSGKIEIYSNQLKEMGYNPLPLYRDYLEYESKDTGIGIKDLEREYPLILTKHNSPVYLHSQLRNIPLAKEIEPEPFLEIHPLTAKEVDIQNGDRVIIESPRGMIKAKADITNLTHPKVVFLVHGWEEANFNTLVSGNILDPVSGSPAARECRVRIRRE